MRRSTPAETPPTRAATAVAVRAAENARVSLQLAERVEEQRRVGAGVEGVARGLEDLGCNERLKGAGAGEDHRGPHIGEHGQDQGGPATEAIRQITRRHLQGNRRHVVDRLEEQGLLKGEHRQEV
jgi:hypothetical protein